MKTHVVDTRSGARQVRVVNNGDFQRHSFVRDSRDVHIDVIAGDDGIPAAIPETRAWKSHPRQMIPTEVDIIWRREDTDDEAGWKLAHLRVAGVQRRADGSMGQRRVSNDYLRDGWWDTETHKRITVPTPDWLAEIVRQHDPTEVGWPLDNEAV